MKTLSKNIIVAALSVMGLVSSFSLMAADSAVVTVSATVAGACKFTSGGSVTFVLDPASAALATGAVVQPIFWCTNPTTYTITDNGGTHAKESIRRMQHSTAPSQFIPYTFTYATTGNGAGKSSPITLNIASTVANTDFINAQAGNYTDTVTLTIMP